MEKQNHVLVVEDEPDLNTMLCDYLNSQGYACTPALDGAQAVSEFFRVVPDLVILDGMLPHIDGLDVLRTIRQAHTTPVIMVTARGQEEDRLDGFATGADDYVVKPFSLKEIGARVAAVLRRSGPARDSAANRLTRGPLSIDGDKMTAYIGGSPLRLTAAQYSILATLAQSPGRVFTRMQLLESFQDHAFSGYERTIDVHIKNIRKRIETDPSEPLFVETVWGVGYRFSEGPWE